MQHTCLSDYYVRVSFFIETPGMMSREGHSLSIVPLSWNGYVEPRDVVRAVRQKGTWHVHAFWPKNATVYYVITMRTNSDGNGRRTHRESLLRTLRLEQENVVIKLTFNDRHNVMTSLEWECALLPNNPTYVRAGPDVHMSTPIDPTWRILIARQRHVNRDQGQLRAARIRRQPRAIRGKDVVDRHVTRQKWRSNNVAVTCEPPVQVQGDVAVQDDENKDQSDGVLKRCLKYALPGLGVGVAVGLAARWAWSRWGM